MDLKNSQVGQIGRKAEKMKGHCKMDIVKGHCKLASYPVRFDDAACEAVLLEVHHLGNEFLQDAWDPRNPELHDEECVARMHQECHLKNGTKARANTSELLVLMLTRYMYSKK
jgi:hypothetical protein